MKQIGHTILRKGDIITSHKTKKSYIVIDSSTEEVLFVPVTRHQKKNLNDIRDWTLSEDDDRRTC